MQLFFKKISLYGLLVFVTNLALGAYLKSYESVDLKEAGIFFSDLRWDDYYNLDEPIDALILGSSHAYRSYHPATIRKAIQLKNAVFNFGSSAQTPVTSYFVLNEMLEKQRPKIVVLDVYIMVFTSDNQLNNGRYNFHSMNWSANKNQFLKEGFIFNEQMKLLFFPGHVYRNHFKNKLNKLLGRSYLPAGKGQYEKNGFAFNEDTLAIEKLKFDNQFSKFNIQKEQITEKNVAYLKKMVERCQTENIPIVFMSSPMPSVSVDFIKEYPAISARFADLAKELEVPYYDFNIERIPEVKDEFHYYDDDHLNLSGAKIFSKKAAEMMQKHLNN